MFFSSLFLPHSHIITFIKEQFNTSQVKKKKTHSKIWGVKLSQLSLNLRWAANGLFLASFAILTNSPGVQSCMCMDEHIYRSDGVVCEISTVHKSLCFLVVLLKCVQRCCRLLRLLGAQHHVAASAFPSICFHKIYPAFCLVARMGASWNSSEINSVTNKKRNTLFLYSVPVVSLFALLDLRLQERNSKGDFLMKCPKLIPLPWHSSSSSNIKKK